MNSLSKFGLVINLFLFIFAIITGGLTGTVVISTPWGVMTFLLTPDFIVGLIILIGVICAAVGIQVLGSGLSNTSVRVVVIILTNVFVWILLTMFSYNYFISIPILGSVLYWVLTLTYAVGMVLNIQSLGDGGEE